MRSALQIGEGGLVWRHESGAGATLNAHVADRHALLHGEGADRLAGVFKDVTGAAAHADARDQREDDVLRGDALLQVPVNADEIRFWRALEQTLGGEHHLDFARADTKRKRTKCTVRGGVRVAADNGGAWLREAELWPNDVDDPLVRRLPAVQRNAELVAVRLKLLHLCGSHLVGDRQVAWCGWDGVVRGGDCFVWTTHR